jgi:hypothetical protein
MHSLATPGPIDFREPVQVDRVDGEGSFDLQAHLLGPGFGTEESDAQTAWTPGRPLVGLEFVGDD